MVKKEMKVKLNFNYPMKDVLWAHGVIENDIPAYLLQKYYTELKALNGKELEFEEFIRKSWKWFYENGGDYPDFRRKLCQTLIKQIQEEMDIPYNTSTAIPHSTDVCDLSEE